MSFHVEASVQAAVSGPPKQATEVKPSELARGWSRAFFVVLITMQVAWLAVLLYGATRVIGTIGGLV
jgi:hypothetical protein